MTHATCNMVTQMDVLARIERSGRATDGERGFRWGARAQVRTDRDCSAAT
ncbi:hypothetical protein [Azospirillum endophyticum]